ncbi:MULTISPECIES: hypothetical protein [Deefgea]|uniref:Tetratricopeptide repeat protein n=1 Tax=Deefgea chitinilytica TaxID=570276 RepID=A0ABS2CED1_9NEIS|nr:MULTISPECIES: hypothetical protein [Deefgea]MBM5571746.1 hypothetical protein [Deefgea chitinilytica]MBM9888981.1 hypothetical protein [Deefgea sp. CFH1-16]
MMNAVQLGAHNQQLAEMQQLIFTEPVLARQKCGQLLAHARHAFDAPTFISAALSLSLIEDQLGDLQQAISVLSEALVFAEEFKQKQRIPQLLEQIGRCHYSQANYPQALDYWHQCALQCGQQNDLLETRALALIGLGQICDACGENAQAIHLHQLAHDLLLSINNYFLLTMAKINWAVNLQKTGQSEAARTILQESLQLSLAHELPHHAAESQFRLAEIAISLDELILAEQYIEEGLMTVALTPYHWCEINLLALWAQLSYRAGRLAQALDIVKRGLHIAEEDGLRHLVFRLSQQAVLYARAGGLNAIADEYQRKIDFLQVHLHTEIAQPNALNLQMLRDLIA